MVCLGGEVALLHEDDVLLHHLLHQVLLLFSLCVCFGMVYVCVREREWVDGWTDGWMDKRTHTQICIYQSVYITNTRKEKA